MKASERFLKYITFDTQSDESSDTCPSTAKQKLLGQFLKEELEQIGAIDAEMDENGYVYGTVPASPGQENAPVLALISHMDTSPSASGKDVKAVITHETTSEGERDVIRSDGTTLLGADDKAGIAEIMTAAEIWLKADGQAFPHPEIRVVFTPDEEIGRGTDRIDMDKVKAAYAFTVDGGEVGELTYECFNAAAAVVEVRGASYHPGDSFGKMKNAVLIAQEFNALLPANETPATTRGREGFYHLCDIRGDVSYCELQYILRDHDKHILEKRKQKMLDAADCLNHRYNTKNCSYTAMEKSSSERSGKDDASGNENAASAEKQTVTVKITDSYENMVEAILPKYEFLLDAVREVYGEMGLVPDESPIRGGTDGARLSFMGLPCPNLGTGGHDFHGPHEYITIQSMDKAVEVLIRLAGKLTV